MTKKTLCSSCAAPAIPYSGGQSTAEFVVMGKTLALLSDWKFIFFKKIIQMIKSTEG